MTDKDFEKLKELNQQMKEIELFNDEFLQKNKGLFEPYTDCLISKEKVLLMLSDLLKIANKEEFTVHDTIDHAYEWVKNMPIAYDIDKVVEELEKLQDKAFRVNDEIVEASIYATGMMGKAIEIVKNGGK